MPGTRTLAPTPGMIEGCCNQRPMRAIADRAEDEPCQRLTVGCCIDHTATDEQPCETW